MVRLVLALAALIIAACSAPHRGPLLVASPLPQPFSDGSFNVVVSRTAGAMAESGTLKQWSVLQTPIDHEPISPPAPGLTPLDPASVYAQRVPSVLVIMSIYKCEKCPLWHLGSTAAGFVIAPGVLVTNWHVVESKTDQFAAAVTCRGDVLAITDLLARREPDDIALLRFDPAGLDLAPIPLRDAAPVGSPVLAIAHPDRKYWTLTEGLLSRRASVYGGVNADRRDLRPRNLNEAPPTGRLYEPVYPNMLRPIVTVTADFGVGSSGGPILDFAGNALGMIASTHTVFSAGGEGHDHEREPQMTIRTCVPAESIRDACRSRSD
ncbi:MAG: hypothetical protein HBSAPP03_12360 [Phycisphaerae bacterium]|nr:MAG: hypothetical protein HBSAPP03_12360 [Phycisphaerae bacterium]